jgi:hypothetical protein
MVVLMVRGVAGVGLLPLLLICLGVNDNFFCNSFALVVSHPIIVCMLWTLFLNLSMWEDTFDASEAGLEMAVTVDGVWAPLSCLTSF